MICWSVFLWKPSPGCDRSMWVFKSFSVPKRHMHIGHVLTAIDDFWNKHSELRNTLQYEYQGMKIKCKDLQKGKLNTNTNNTIVSICWFYIYFLNNCKSYRITVMLMVILTELSPLYIGNNNISMSLKKNSIIFRDEINYTKFIRLKFLQWQQIRCCVLGQHHYLIDVY